MTQRRRHVFMWTSRLGPVRLEESSEWFNVIKDESWRSAEEKRSAVMIPVCLVIVSEDYHFLLPVCTLLAIQLCSDAKWEESSHR